MNRPPRDWDRELADIDKAIEKQGSEGAVEGTGRGAVAAPVAAPARSAVALTWVWTLLAVGLGIALALWPYERGCGMRLAFWLGAAGLTAVAGLLGAVTSWASRRGFAHLLSLLVLVWAGAAVTSEVLPRTGYARESRTWFCPEAAPAPAPQPGTSAPTVPPATPQPQTGTPPAPATTPQPQAGAPPAAP